MKISLCMIARDEARNLAQCLGSAASFVDEIIVVDTGSTDQTKEVAVSFGARVEDHNIKTHPSSFFIDDEATCSQFGAPPPFSGLVALGDFAAARNHSFSLATGDFILWLDSDDVLERGENLRALVADMAARNLDTGFVAYDYARDHLDRTHYRQWRERVVRRGAHDWINPIHEVMLPKPGRNAHARYDSLLVVHRRKGDRATIPNRNYKNLLRQYVQQKATNSVDPRTLFYLGQEARFVEAERAVAFYEEYLQKSGWGEERSAAHLALGQIYEFGQISLPVEQSRARSYEHYGVAAIEMPDNPDGLFGLARIAYLRGMWHDCCSFTERGLAIGNTESMLGANPQDRLYRPHIFYNHALSNLGRIAEAAESCRAGLRACPDDPGVFGAPPGMLTHNLKIYEQQLAGAQQMQPQQPDTSKGIWADKNEDVDAPPMGVPRDALVIWAMQLWKHVVAEGNGDKARALLAALPNEVTLDAVIAKMRASTERRFARSTPAERVDVKNPFASFAFGAAPDSAAHAPSDIVGRTITRPCIAFWIGPNIEPWCPKTPLERGVGGSETACIELARELAALGHDVVVYGDCQGMEGIYDGVLYRDHRAFLQPNSQIPCDVFVSSRDPGILLRDGFVRAKTKILWAHDIHCGPPSAEMERALLRFDRVFCLSNWHKDYFCSVYPTLHPERVVVTRNGIDPQRFTAFDAAAPRANRLIWSSSPNRGLQLALGNLQWVRQKVPDAELHIYYGFDTWEKFAQLRGDPAELREIQLFRDIIKQTPGAVYHGRVNQRELAEAFLASKVWYYPTGFTETSCCHPDTLISIPGDHRGGTPRVRIADLVGQSGFPVYAYDAEQHRFRIATANKVWETKIADEMVAIDLDDGNVLRLTPDHLVMNFDGEWVQAGDLQPGNRLMALHHRYDVRIKDADGSWASESRLVGEWLAGRTLLKTEHVDHDDPFRLDNTPDRLHVMTASEHFSKTHRGRARSKTAVAQRVVGWKKWAVNNQEELRSRLARNGEKLWEGVRAMSVEDQKRWNSERARKRVAVMQEREKNDPAYAARMLAQRQENGRRGAEKRWNHKVVAVRRIPGGPVYDMEVEGLHNFVAEGVVIHNCVSAMEAQAAGTYPVTSALAALPETLKFGTLIDIADPAYGQKHVDATVAALNTFDEPLARVARQSMHDYAVTKLTWSSLAEEWSKMFDRIAQNVAVNPIPRWKAAS